jgi:hypothetical protein
MSAAVYVDTRDLPDSLRASLSDAGYHRKDIAIEPRETASMVGFSGQGRKAFVVLVDLATGRTESHSGSWGGANMFSPQNAVDLDTTERPIPPGMAVIKGTSGYHGCFATIHLHPDNVARLLPSKPEVTEREASILGTFGYKPGYRKERWQEMGVTPIELDALISRGMLSKNRAGAISITTAGKNCKGRLP